MHASGCGQDLNDFTQEMIYKGENNMQWQLSRLPGGNGAQMFS